MNHEKIETRSFGSGLPACNRPSDRRHVPAGQRADRPQKQKNRHGRSPQRTGVTPQGKTKKQKLKKFRKGQHQVE